MPIFEGVVTIQSPSLGGIGTNTWHFRTVGGAGASDNAVLIDASTALEDFYGAIQARFAGGTTLAHDGIWSRVDDDSGDLEDVPGWSQSTSGGSPMPPQDSLVIGWRTSNGSRSGRGRTYISPLAVSCLEANGTPDEAARTDLVSAGTALIASMDGELNGSFCVWSETQGVGRDFISCAVRNVFGSLRSRRD